MNKMFPSSRAIALEKFLCLVAPLIAGSLAALPAQAATFAESEGGFRFSQFSHSPLFPQVNTFADTETFAASGGSVTANSNADAVFNERKLRASNSFLSEASGEGRNYVGTAQSEASLLGDFLLNPGETFSFRFSGFLNLLTSLDNPDQERADASGQLSFALFDSTDETNWLPLDFFELVGVLDTPGQNDKFDYGYSDSIHLKPKHTAFQTDFEGTEELITATFKGEYKRSFEQATRLTLLEIKGGEARVEVPEPATALALVVLAGGIVGWQRKQPDC